MSAPIARIEQGDTRQHTAAYSSAPSTPLFTIHAGSGQGTLVQSGLAASSSTLDFYAYFRADTPDLFVYTWTASYASGPVVNRGLFQVIKTTPG